MLLTEADIRHVRSDDRDVEARLAEVEAVLEDVRRGRRHPVEALAAIAGIVAPVLAQVVEAPLLGWPE